MKHPIFWSVVAVGALAGVAWYLQRQQNAAAQDLLSGIKLQTSSVLGNLPGLGLVPLFADPTAAQQLRSMPVQQ